MTSVKIKFRPSTVEGREGGFYFHIIHNRVVRQLNTDYRIIASDYFVHDALITSAAQCLGFLYKGVLYIMYDVAPHDFWGLTNLKLESRTVIKTVLFNKTKSSLSQKKDVL